MGKPIPAWTAELIVIGILASLAAPLAFAQQLSGSESRSSLTPPIGTVISSANESTYTQFLPPASDLGIKYGMTMRVIPTKRIDWSEGFTSATEKYSPQVGLNADDYVTNYIAGMPFPTVSTTDPKAAVKIAYNWHMGPSCRTISRSNHGAASRMRRAIRPIHSHPMTRKVTSAITSSSFATRIAPRSIRVQP